MTGRNGIGLVAVVLCLVLPAAAFAQAPLDEAKVRFKRGSELYDENNFRAALIEFQRAYDLAPSFRLLYNIGQVQMQLQDYAGAERSFSRYLNEGATDVPAARRDEVTAEIAKLKGRVASVTVETAAGAEVLVDDVSVGFSPLPEALTVNTGRHKITVSIAGRDAASRWVDVAGQQSLTVSLANDRPIDEGVSVSAVRAGPRSKLPAIVLWSATAALGISAAIAGAVALGDSNRLVQQRATFGTTRAQLDATGSGLHTASLVSDVLSCAAIVTGIVAMVVTVATSGSPSSRAAALALAFSGTGLSVKGGF